MKIEKYENEISTAEYVREYVNVEEFLVKCSECENYDRKWSCPSFDFDSLKYWRSREMFKVFARKIIFETDEERGNWEELLWCVKKETSLELEELEKSIPGSIALSAGSCQLCGEDNCTRKNGLPCRYPDKLRYSIEALGGNVGLTISRLLGIELQWITENNMPDYFVLVLGLLY